MKHLFKFIANWAATIYMWFLLIVLYYLLIYIGDKLC